MDSDVGEEGFIVCSCNNCLGHIEFPVSGVGSEVDCPHCGSPTSLFKPAKTFRSTQTHPTIKPSIGPQWSLFVIPIVVTAIIVSVVLIKLHLNKERTEIKERLTSTLSELNEFANVGKCFTNIVYLCRDQTEKSETWRCLNERQLKNLEEARLQLLDAQLLLPLLFDDELKSKGVDATKTGSKLIEFSEGLPDEDPYLFMSFFEATREYTPRVESFVKEARRLISRAIEEF